jgi:hypothetical protein
MFTLALAMELYGTALGNWTWRPVVPGLGIGAANPPFAAGAFYALLDLLVLAAVSALARSVADPGRCRAGACTRRVTARLDRRTLLLEGRRCAAGGQQSSKRQGNCCG